MRGESCNSPLPVMHKYKNLQGNSGVRAYETGPDRVIVRFVNGETYTYTYATAGKEHIEHMKVLAREGRGLSTFISTTVKDKYLR